MLDPLLEAGIRVDDVPLAFLGPKLRAELLVRVRLGGRLLGLVVCRGDRGIRLLEGVDVERVVDLGIRLGVDRSIECFEQSGEIALLLGVIVGVDDVNCVVLGENP